MINLIPVVITTADLMSAEFETASVSLTDGKIEPKDLKLTSRKWLAVNYRASDVVCQYSQFSNNTQMAMGEYVRAWQARTVFVVRAEHVMEFLTWLDRHFSVS